MSLLDLMSGGQKLMKVHVNEIRCNPLNFYAEVSENEDLAVEDMAMLLKEDGQDNNGVVYEDTSVDDGKKYTLISGERRWKATKLNYENGIGDGMYDVKLIPKPENQPLELLRIIRNNAQRNKSKEVRKAEVSAMETIWDDLVAQGKKPSGKKREWIAANIELSPRRVQEYLTGEESAREMPNEEGGSSATLENNENELTSSDQEYLKNLAENLTNSTGRKVKISNKFVISFRCNGFYDIPTVLDDLGFTEDGYWK